MDVVTVIQAVLASVVYSLFGYFKSGEPFDVEKFLKTFLLGIFIGICAAFAGVQVTEDWVKEAFDSLTFVGVTALIEFLLKGIKKRILK